MPATSLRATPRRACALLTGGVLAAGLLSVPATAGAAEAGPPDGTCDAPVGSTTQEGFMVADPDCDLDGTPFAPLTDEDGKALSAC